MLCPTHEIPDTLLVLRSKSTHEAGTSNAEPRTPNPEPRTPNREPRTENREPRTANREPRTPNPEPRTPNPNAEHEPGTRNVEPGTSVHQVLFSQLSKRLLILLPTRRDVARVGAGFDLMTQRP